MLKPVVLVDIDETIVRVKDKWKEWCSKELGYSLDFTKEITDIDSLEFWKQKDLYDDLEPIKEAQEGISILREYYDIIFVSHCFNEHIDSKGKFLHRHFDETCFIDTEHKHKIRCDYIIDDRERFLNRDDCCTILHKTEFKSTGVADYEMDWIQIKEFLIQEYYNREKGKNERDR